MLTNAALVAGQVFAVVVFLGLCAAVALILYSQDKHHASRREPQAIKPPEVSMPAEKFFVLVDDLNRNRTQVAQLRLALQELIDHWPGSFTPMELAKAQGLVDATGVDLES